MKIRSLNMLVYSHYADFSK